MLEMEMSSRASWPHLAFSGGLLGMGTASTCPLTDCERLLCFSALLFPPVQGMALFLGLSSLQMCEKHCEPRTSSTVPSGLIKLTTLSHKSNCSFIQRPSQLQAYPQQKNVGIFICQHSCCCTGIRHWQDAALLSLSNTS